MRGADLIKFSGGWPFIAPEFFKQIIAPMTDLLHRVSSSSSSSPSSLLVTRKTGRESVDVKRYQLDPEILLAVLEQTAAAGNNHTMKYYVKAAVNYLLFVRS